MFCGKAPEKDVRLNLPPTWQPLSGRGGMGVVGMTLSFFSVCVPLTVAYGGLKLFSDLHCSLIESRNLWTNLR